jgi:hypothetical protein
MPLNPATQDFIPHIPHSSPEQIFLQKYYPNYPRNYLDHVISPAFNSERVPYLQPQTFAIDDSQFHAMLAGREAAAIQIYLRIDAKRTMTWSRVAITPVTAQMVLEMRRALVGRANVEEKVETLNPLLEPWQYGYAAMIFHTIFMMDGDLARLVRGVRAVIQMGKRGRFGKF